VLKYLSQYLFIDVFILNFKVVTLGRGIIKIKNIFAIELFYQKVGG